MFGRIEAEESSKKRGLFQRVFVDIAIAALSLQELPRHRKAFVERTRILTTLVDAKVEETRVLN